MSRRKSKYHNFIKSFEESDMSSLIWYYDHDWDDYYYDEVYEYYPGDEDVKNIPYSIELSESVYVYNRSERHEKINEFYFYSKQDRRDHKLNLLFGLKEVNPIPTLGDFFEKN